VLARQCTVTAVIGRPDEQRAARRIPRSALSQSGSESYLLPEAWIAPPEVRQLRALLRHRISLVRLGTQLRNRIHAVAADHGYDRSSPGRARPCGMSRP
jgi:hypothetical protein